jgi:glyoxylase-like metal-dependent hydrolase (beta-lactamase superfamily II)
MDDIGAQYIVLDDAESIENTIILIPSQQILFVGDLASNGIHMWLAEGRLDNWLAQLKFLRSLGTFSAIYPGHGPVGGMVLLEQAEKYITDFQHVVRSSRDVDMAIETMLALYPEYKLAAILEGSVRSVMASRNLIKKGRN